MEESLQPKNPNEVDPNVPLYKKMEENGSAMTLDEFYRKYEEEEKENKQLEPLAQPVPENQEQEQKVEIEQKPIESESKVESEQKTVESEQPVEKSELTKPIESDEEKEKYKSLQTLLARKILNLPTDDNRSVEEIFEEIKKINPDTPYEIGGDQETLEKMLKEAEEIDLKQKEQSKNQNQNLDNEISNEVKNPEPEREVKKEEKETETSQTKPEEKENIDYEWKKSEQWQKLENLRNNLIEAETNLDPEQARTLGNEYLVLKEEIAKMIKDEMWGKLDAVPTPEQEQELKNKVNQIAYNELVKKEQDLYLDTLKSKREKTIGDKAKEGLKNVLSNKAVQWYLKQNKWVRLGATTLLFTTVGYAVGAAAVGGGLFSAAAYGAGRLARGGASILAGGAARVAAEKRWSVEDIEKEAKTREEEIAKMDVSIEEKTKMYEDLRGWKEHEKKWAIRKKAMVTVGVGLGAGLFAGLTEGITSEKGMSSQILETKGPKSSDVLENRISSRQGYEPTHTTPVEPVESVKTTEAAPIGATAALIEKIFDDPSVLQHKVVAGDSAWKILEKTLDHNEQFKNMTEAQRTYVLSSFTNKIMESPEDYNFNRDGSITVGNQTDFSKLFDDDKEIKSIFNKAEQTIQAGSAQEESILINNQKIANWVKKHPNESYEDKLSDILEDKGESKEGVEILEKVSPDKPGPSISNNQEALDQIADESQIAREAEKNIENNVEYFDKTQQAENIAPQETPQPDENFGRSVDEQQIHQEIAEAKKRLAELENNKTPKIPENMPLEGDFQRQVEAAFSEEINSIYGKKGVLGFGKVSGINSKEWLEMSRLPANKIIDFYTTGSLKSGLPNDIATKLSESSNHLALMKQTVELMDQSGGAVKPFENENMEQFIKRLGGFVLKSYLDKTV